MGELVFPGGERYEGEFQVGQFHGYGIYLTAGGMKYEVGKSGCGLYYILLMTGAVCEWTSEGKGTDNLT